MKTVLNDRFEILEEFESTSIFRSYKALDKAKGHNVFIRITKQEYVTPEFNERLSEVVQNVSGIRAVGVERIHAIYESDGTPYVVSEYFPANTLEHRLKRLATLSVPVAIAMAIEICDALEALHQSGVIHGDVSPRTILSTTSEGIKVILPGFWRAYGQSEAAARHMAREMTPFMAPEVSGGGMPTQLSDIYSLGIMLWRILVGRYPYNADNPSELAMRHATAPYPSARGLNGSIPQPVDDVLRKCLEKNPLMRYPSVAALRNDLKSIQDSLRFGTPIVWSSTGQHEFQEPAEVAPRLNALDAQPQVEPEKKAKPKPSKRKKVSKADDRLPVWLTGLFYLLTALTVLIAGGWMFFNLQKPKIISVPNLVGKQVDEARTELRELGLKLREVRREQSDKFSSGQIMTLAPSVGEDVYVGTYVEAVVSSGSRFVEIPDFRGRTLTETRDLARSLDLKISEDDIEYVPSDEVEEGRIVSQIPEPRKKVERQTGVKLKISSGERRPGQSQESQSGRYTVSFPIPDDIRDSVTVRIDMTDDHGTKTVYERNHSAGDEVSERFTGYGDRIIFRVFFDGELIDQVTKEAEGDSN